MFYSELTRKAYLFAANGKEKIIETELLYPSEPAAYSAFIYSEEKSKLLLKAKSIFLELPSRKEPDYKAIDAFLKKLTTIELLERVTAEDLQKELDKANSLLPGANLEYYEHLATSK